MGRTKWCQVRVLKNGRLDWPYEGARVSGKVGGFWGGFTSEVCTDDRGIATIEWQGESDLECIYVSGQTFSGCFEEGRSYSINYSV